MEEIQPSFSNHVKGTLPGVEAHGIALTVIAGEAFRQRSPVPVYSDLMYVDAILKPGARLQVPPEHVERAVFVVVGEIEVVGQSGTFGDEQLVVFKPDAEIVLEARRDTHLMLVGGEPFAEPRHIYWNFVSSSQDRIKQAKDDWRYARFPEIAGETEFIPLPPEEN
jgi:redox-sensitive bicupin YhaK (pirin superfamily)